MPLVVLRLFLLILLLVVLFVPHLLTKAILRRRPVGRLFLWAAGWIMGLRVKRVGDAPIPATLFVANHQSWLDILVLGGSAGSAFVSKAEIQDHWLLKWLADQRHTLYVERQARRDVAAQIAAVRRRFDHYLPLAIFPEGTTGDGKVLLPFRPSLLAAVTPPPNDARIVPAAIDYGDASEFVAWHGDEAGLANVKRVLSRWRPIPVTLRLLPPLEATDDRKALAERARSAIANALGLEEPSAYSAAP